MRWLALLLIIGLPVAAAQDTVPGTYPPDTEPPDPEESVEEAPGISWGVFLVMAIMAFAVALAWVGWRQARRPPSAP